MINNNNINIKLNTIFNKERFRSRAAELTVCDTMFVTAVRILSPRGENATNLNRKTIYNIKKENYDQAQLH